MLVVFLHHKKLANVMAEVYYYYYLPRSSTSIAARSTATVRSLLDAKYGAGR